MSLTAEQLQEAFEAVALETTGSRLQQQALIYDDLKRIARWVTGRVVSGETLRTTALLHEAWMRIHDSDQSSIESKQQFMSWAATIMHRVAVDHIRARAAKKRGGDLKQIPFDEAQQLAQTDQPDALILHLHEGLEAMKQFSPSLAELVELLFFVGLTQQEVAELRGSSERTIRRDWRKARAWLFRFLNEESAA